LKQKTNFLKRINYWKSYNTSTWKIV